MQFLAIFNSKSAYFTLHPCNLHVWAHADLTWYDHISPISWYTFGYLQFYVWFLFGRSASHFSDSWWILAIFGNSFFGGINTPYFGLFGWTNSIFFGRVKKEPLLCGSSGQLSGGVRASYDGLVSWWRYENQVTNYHLQESCLQKNCVQFIHLRLPFAKMLFNEEYVLR